MDEMRIVGYCYPWDIIGDPDFLARAADWGIETLALAGYYHGVRAATPAHPEHRIVDAEHSALYLSAAAVERNHWSGLRPPLPGHWVDDGTFERAGQLAAGAGFRVLAWAAPTHADGWPESAGESVVDAFGVHRRYALCPARPATRRFVVDVLQALAGAGADGSVLEATGMLGVDHASLHDKIDGADWGLLTRQLLSLCFCSECRRRSAEAGRDPDADAELVRRHGRIVDEARAVDLVQARSRQHDEAAAALQGSACGAAAAAGMPVEAVHYSPVPASFGAASPTPPPHATTRPTTDDAPAAAVLNDWPQNPSIIDELATTAQRAPGAPLAVYLHAARTRTGDQFADHLAALRGAGVSSIHLYHLGLVAPHLIDDVVRAVRG